MPYAAASGGERKTRRDGFLAVEFVDDVDPVVGSVRAGDAEEDRCPAPEAEASFLFQLGPEVERASYLFVVFARSLWHAFVRALPWG
jgi:hypothetical protein